MDASLGLTGIRLDGPPVLHSPYPGILESLVLGVVIVAALLMFLGPELRSNRRLR